MASSMIELSKYRFERAYEVLNDARLLLKEKSLKSSVNRSYYAIKLDTAYRLREKADYDDFVIVSRDMAEEQLISQK